MPGKRCGSIGCKSLATHTLTYSFPGDRDLTFTELVCRPCGEGYTRRPTLKATITPIAVPSGRKRNKLFVWEGVLTDYSSGMVVAVAPSLEAAYALLETQVGAWGMQDVRATEPTVIDSLTCEPQAWHVSGGG